MPELRVDATNVEQQTLVKLRGQFYKGHAGAWKLNGDNELRAAINTVSLWRERGPLPHALVSTADLAKAYLADRETVSSITPLVYAQAFSNFVTGYTDTQQTLKRKMTMFEIGKAIGLPDSYIKLRHDIVHGQMPSLIELRRFALGALSWLGEEYWSQLPQPIARRREEIESVVLKTKGADQKVVVKPQSDAEQIRAVIDNYQKRTALRAGENRFQGATTLPVICCGSASRKLQRLCGSDEGNLELLASYLLQPGCMLPKASQHYDFVDASLQWWPLIKSFIKLVPEFERLLATELIRRLASLPAKNNAHDSESVPLKAWIDRLIAEGDTNDSLLMSNSTIHTIMSACLAQPGPYTTTCVLQLYESKHYSGCKALTDKDLLRDLKQWVKGLSEANIKPSTGIESQFLETSTASSMYTVGLDGGAIVDDPEQAQILRTLALVVHPTAIGVATRKI